MKPSERTAAMIKEVSEIVPVTLEAGRQYDIVMGHLAERLRIQESRELRASQNVDVSIQRTLAEMFDELKRR